MDMAAGMKVWSPQHLGMQFIPDVPRWILLFNSTPTIPSHMTKSCSGIRYVLTVVLNSVAACILVVTSS